MSESPGIRDAKGAASQKPPEHWPDARYPPLVRNVYKLYGTNSNNKIMEHAREKTIGGLLLQTRVSS